MSAADLISLGSLVVAIVAFVVSYLAYRVQQRTQDSTEEQNLNELREKLNDLIERIQSSLATMAQPQTTFKLDTVVSESAALTALQGQALEARRLARLPGITLDWFQNMVLAYALSQAWDPASAEEFWVGAVTAATTSQARIRSLTARAEFYYMRGLNGDGHNDWRDARADYRAALAELRRDPDGQGPDLVAQQAAFMELQQAFSEFKVGNDSMAVGLVADAFVDANSVTAPWRKISGLDRLGGLAQAMENLVIPPREVMPDVAAELSRRGISPDTFPAKTAALLLMSPDGSQLSGLYGESS
ncbi:MAG TPA: hypothetical protein VME44_24560 [Streptosporangiaceae bacterium]|nr:hypothetical protein [Streptosporangiaceae bacterium]